jgi:PIN like domain
LAGSQHDDLVFFLDRCLGKKIVAERLGSAGLRVEVHADHFPETENSPEEHDGIWLITVGRKGWVILTKDERIRRNQIELAALLASGAPSFASTAGNITGEQLADSFLAAMPQIRRFLKRHQPPFIATVSRLGTVRMLLPHSDLIRRL